MITATNLEFYFLYRNLIHVDFEPFQVEEHPEGTCGWDSVEIWDYVRREPNSSQASTEGSDHYTLTEAGGTVEDSVNPQGTIEN